MPRLQLSVYFTVMPVTMVNIRDSDDDVCVCVCVCVCMFVCVCVCVVCVCVCVCVCGVCTKIHASPEQSRQQYHSHKQLTQRE